MIKNIYAVRDLKATAFLFPHFDASHGEAIRHFGDLVKNTKSPFYAHPEDYSLFFVGQFDDIEAKVIPLKEQAVYMAQALDFVQKNNEVPIPEVV